jgi:hypothetical protein
MMSIPLPIDFRGDGSLGRGGNDNLSRREILSTSGGSGTMVGIRWEIHTIFAVAIYTFLWGYLAVFGIRLFL